MGMLDTYTYETTLLTTATDIVYNDVYEMVRERYSSLRRAYSASWR